MTTAGNGSLLARLFEHHRWANDQLLEVCAGLTDEQLDRREAEGSWSLRELLLHLIEADESYLALLTIPLAKRERIRVPYEELGASTSRTGAALLELALRHDDAQAPSLDTTDGYDVEPWVVLVQVINHGNHHRRQACGMLRRMGIEPPDLDGWTYGIQEDACRKR